MEGNKSMTSCLSWYMLINKTYIYIDEIQLIYGSNKKG